MRFRGELDVSEAQVTSEGESSMRGRNGERADKCGTRGKADVGCGRTRRSARVGRGAESRTLPSDDGQNTASDLGTTSNCCRVHSQSLSSRGTACSISLRRPHWVTSVVARQPHCPRPAFPLTVLASISPSQLRSVPGFLLT